MEKNQQNFKRNQQDKKQRKKSRYKRFLWSAWCFLFSLIFIGTILGSAIVVYVYVDALNNLPPLNLDIINTSRNTEVFDSTDQYVNTLGEDTSINVEYNQLSQSVIDAFNATEDSRFFTHKGIDGGRTVRAIFGTYFLGNDSGGSTITQQLVKNTILAEKISKNPDYKNSEKRKIDEWILSYELEKQMSKQEILTAYLNNAISYDRFTGIGTAAKRYFNKNVSELNIAEAAMLAGIPQLPAENNPFYDIDSATKRYEVVIDLMVRHKYITSEEANAAKAIPLADIVIRNQDEVLNPNNAYFSGVISQLEKIFGQDTSSDTTVPVYFKNFRIYTYLNQEQQTFANEIMQTDNYVDWESGVINAYGSDYTPEDDMNFQGAFTVIDVKTGGIPAIGSSRNIKETINYAYDGFRSPGSSIKPIIDYAPAVEKFGWSSHHIMIDKPTNYTGGGAVYNYNNGGYSGPKTMKSAIADSTNTTAVQAFQQATLEYAVGMAGDMGLTRAKPLLESGNIGEAAALGGGIETTTAELAGAYATLASGGQFRQPSFIRRIENMNGDLIWQQSPAKAIVSEATAATLTESLLYSRSNGTPAGAGRKQIDGSIQFGAKTGTSSYGTDERAEYGISLYAERDHWYAGYSPDYAIASWTGLVVENEEVLKRTGGNSRENRALGSFMAAAWINKFSPEGTNFEFLGAANRERTGSIGQFTISNNPNTKIVSWTQPAVNYPQGVSDANKDLFGGLVFDVAVVMADGEIALASGITDLQVNYAAYAKNPNIRGIRVTARMNTAVEQIAELIPAVSGVVSIQPEKPIVEQPNTKPNPIIPNETTNNTANNF